MAQNEGVLLSEGVNIIFPILDENFKPYRNIELKNKNMKISRFILITFTAFISLSSPYAQEIQKFYQGGKAGYKNAATGAIIVPAKYYAGSDFFDGYALVIETQKRGFINTKGEVAIPFIYDDASVFFEGLARVSVNNKNGYINKEGKTIIPFIYDFADDFKDGMARVSKDGKYGFIDTKGNIVIELKYINARNFSEGLAAVQTVKWEFINNKGKTIIPAEYDEAVVFYEGLARVRKGDKTFYIDKNAKWVKDEKNFEEEEREREGIFEKNEK